MPTWLRLILAIVFPPLAVADLGTNKLILTSVLFVFLFPFGGPLAAIFFLLRDNRWRHPEREPPAHNPIYDEERYERAYIELADGDVLEVIDTEEDEQRQHKRK